MKKMELPFTEMRRQEEEVCGEDQELGLRHVTSDVPLAPKWRNCTAKCIYDSDFSSGVQTEEQKSVIKSQEGSEHSFREETMDQALDSPTSKG